MKTDMKIYRNVVSVLAAACVLYGCSDWTEPENIDYPSPTVSHPEEYYASLREFKQGDHKISAAAMDGISEHPSSPLQHILSLPDSLDYISVRNASGLHPVIASEIREVNRLKGTKVLCSIDYMKISDAWQAIEDNKDESEAPGTVDEFVAFVAEQTEIQIADCDSYGFHGIMVSYFGTKSGNAAKGQEAFMDVINDWVMAHDGCEILFAGYPVNLVDQSFFDKCKYIVIPVGESYTEGEFSSLLQLYASRLSSENKGKIMLEVNVPSDEFPIQDGYEPQPVTAAKWTLDEDDVYGRCGIMIDNIQDDYLISGTYATSRKAIAIMNN